MSASPIPLLRFLLRCLAKLPFKCDVALMRAMTAPARKISLFLAKKILKRPPTTRILKSHTKIEVYPPKHQTHETTPILYVHGGAFGIHPPTEFLLAAELQKRFPEATLYALHYPLMPEASYEEQRAACINAFQYLKEEYGSLVLIGDSAGGNLALDLALSSRIDLNALKCLILISPFLKVHEFVENCVDPGLDYLVYVWLRRYARMYIDAGGPTTKQFSSALKRVKLPPCTCFVGGNELIRDCASLLPVDEGVKVITESGEVHDYPFTPSDPLSQEGAWKQIFSFIRNNYNS